LLSSGPTLCLVQVKKNYNLKADKISKTLSLIFEKWGFSFIAWLPLSWGCAKKYDVFLTHGLFVGQQD